MYLARVNLSQGYNRICMKLADRIKTYKDYFESLGMKIKYADKVTISCQDDDGIYRSRETGAIGFELEYEVCFYNYEDKKWHKDTSLLCIDTVTTDENVILGYFTEDVAKTILENLVKRKTL